MCLNLVKVLTPCAACLKFKNLCLARVLFELETGALDGCEQLASYPSCFTHG